MAEFHFDDIIKVVQVDADGKKYDKGSVLFSLFWCFTAIVVCNDCQLPVLNDIISSVSRIDAKSQDGNADIVLDINSELYPVNKNDTYRMVLSHTLNLDGSAVGPKVYWSFLQ